MASTTTASRKEKLVLQAPLSGPVVPIEKVPDPVFSERLLGDGIAIDPVDNVLLAPVEGQIIQLYKTGHALTIKTDSNVEILIHIGLDTVALKGKGFKPLAAEGQQVKAGQPLIEFDMDYLACHARSLISVIVLTQAAGLDVVHKAPWPCPGRPGKSSYTGWRSRCPGRFSGGRALWRAGSRNDSDYPPTPPAFMPARPLFWPGPRGAFRPGSCCHATAMTDGQTA